MADQHDCRLQRRVIVVGSDTSSDYEGGGVQLSEFPTHGGDGDNNPYRVFHNSDAASDDAEVGGAATFRPQAEDVEGTKEVLKEGAKTATLQPQLEDIGGAKEGLKEGAKTAFKPSAGAPRRPTMVSALEIIKNRAIARKALSIQAAERIAAASQKLHAATQQSHQMKTLPEVQQNIQAKSELTMKEVSHIPYADKTPVDRLLDSMATQLDFSNSDPNKPSPPMVKAEVHRLKNSDSPEWHISRGTSPFPAYEEPGATFDNHLTSAESSMLGHVRFPSYDFDGHVKRDRELYPESYLEQEASMLGAPKGTSNCLKCGKGTHVLIGSGNNSCSQFSNNTNAAVFGTMNNGLTFVGGAPVAVAGHLGSNNNNNNVGPGGNMRQVAPIGIYPVPMGNNGLPAAFGNYSPANLANLQHVNQAYANNAFGGMLHSVPVRIVPAPNSNNFARNQRVAPAKKVIPRTPPPRFVLPDQDEFEAQVSRFDVDSD